MESLSEDEGVYTLPALVARWGEASEEEVFGFVGGRTKAALIAIGSDVVTTRIDTDAARMLGRYSDFRDRASEAQLEQLPALSDALVRCAVFAAHRAAILYETRQAQLARSKATREGRVAEAAQKVENGRIRRDQLEAALEGLCGQDPVWLARIAAAYGAAPDPEALAKSIEELVQVGLAMLADPAPLLAARIADSRLSRAWLERSLAIAAEARRSGAIADTALPLTPVTQAEVDYWDGMALTLLDIVVTSCEAGHRADPSIPRLVPIALRGWFSPSRGKKKKGGET